MTQDDAKAARDAIMSPEPQPVSALELQVAFSGPAVQANRFFITIGPGGARIAFAEQYGQDAPVFRTAVNLAFQDAFGLAKILKDLLDKNVLVESIVPSADRQDG